MSDQQDRDEHTGTSTTGHEWDGITELDTPMPRWWLWTFYICIVWAIGYCVAYPAWPLINGATSGLLGYSSRAEVAEEITRFDDMNAPLDTALVAAELTAIEQDATLRTYAVNGGGAVFRTYCAQCHGAGAAGGLGYPNLLDDDWLWGGDIEAIHATIAHGIRNEVDDDARYSEMPAFGDILEDTEISAVVNYVQSLSNSDHDAAEAALGAPIFADNCAACHGEDGKGMREQGAPNLTDAIWLYGGDTASLTKTVHDSRFGVMPPWAGRLTEAEIRQVSVYVHGLGGGE